jgi:hypothetical protein
LGDTPISQEWIEFTLACSPYFRPCWLRGIRIPDHLAKAVCSDAQALPLYCAVWVKAFPFQPIGVLCLLCGELRRYVPFEVFLGSAHPLARMIREV